MRRKTYVVAIGLMLTVILAGCTKPVQNTVPTPTNVPVETITPTNTLGPTATNTPELTAEPTMEPTLEPTVTSAPTATPVPNATSVPTSTPTPTIVIEDSVETKKAKELGLVPVNWSNNMTAKADFAGYYELLCNLVKFCDESVMTNLETLINNKNFPDRDINRDDALMMLFLTAEALGYNKQNARGYGFCTENEINFDLANSQISWDYPYCDLMREVSLLTDYGPEPIGTLPTTAQFWLQRHMDINQRLHFFDCDDNLDFHLDEVLTREAAIASVVRLYNAETLNYDAYVGMCQMTETEKNQAKDSVKVQTLTTAKDNELKKVYRVQLMIF